MNPARTPLFIGLSAARANLIPGLLIQATMIALVIAYYTSSATAGLFAHLAALKARHGFGFTTAAMILAAGILPELLRIAFCQKGHVTRDNATNFLFNAIYFAINGVIIDLFYQFQSVLFGTEVTPIVVLQKVIVDQFIYNPVWAAPAVTICLHWKNNGYQRAALLQGFSAQFYRDRVLPVLIATWGVWIPLVLVIYSLPPLLQIPLFSLALTFWVMIVMFISNSDRESVQTDSTGS